VDNISEQAEQSFEQHKARDVYDFVRKLWSKRPAWYENPSRMVISFESTGQAKNDPCHMISQWFMKSVGAGRVHDG